MVIAFVQFEKRKRTRKDLDRRAYNGSFYLVQVSAKFGLTSWHLHEREKFVPEQNISSICQHKRDSP